MSQTSWCGDVYTNYMIHLKMIKAICQILANEFNCLLFKVGPIDTCTNYIKAE